MPSRNIETRGYQSLWEKTMKKKLNTILTGISAIVLFSAGSSLATNGTFLTGNGSRAQGMGGASIAFPQDALAAANNPAGMAYIGTRYDMGTQVIYADVECEVGPLSNSGSAYSPVPEFGFNYKLNEHWSLGMSSAPHGASFTYDNQLFTGVSGLETSSTFMGVTFLPTATYRPSPNLSLGLAAAITIQAFECENLYGTPNSGMEYATGFGWRTGVSWSPATWVTIGAMFAPRIDMSDQGDYADTLLASVGGAIDVPCQYGTGVAFPIGSKLTLAADYLKIEWSGTQFKELFGWRDQNVFRAGVNYVLNPKWTLRAGGSYANRHFKSEYTLNNLMLVGINSKSLSMGFTHNLPGKWGDVTMGIEKDFGSESVGSGSSAGSKLDTTFYIFSIGYGKSF